MAAPVWRRALLLREKAAVQARLPVAMDANLHYRLDLTHDIEEFRKLCDDQLRKAVGAKSTSPIRRVKVNASPFVCSLWEIDARDLEPCPYRKLDPDILMVKTAKQRPSFDTPMALNAPSFGRILP